MKKVTIKGHKITLYWDKDDNIYVAEAKGLPGCMAHGDTQKAALEQMKIAIDGHLQVYGELKRAILG